MNLIKLIKDSGKLDMQAIGLGAYGSVLSSSPIPTLLRPLIEWETMMRNTLPGYDAVVAGMSSCETMLEAVAQDAIEGIPDNPVEINVVIPETEAQALISGIVQGMDIIDPNAAYLNLVSSAGLTYQLIVDQQNQVVKCVNGNLSQIPVIFKDGDDWKVRKVWPSLTCPDDIEHAVGDLTLDAQENFLSLMSSLVDSASINATLIDCISSLRSGKLSTWLTTATSWALDTKKAIVKVVKSISLAFSQGGIKGVIYYLYSVIRGLGSLTDENGVMKFTNNTAMLPKEYIAGVIGTVVQGLISVVGAVLTMIQPIIGLIVSVLGTVAWAIFGSFKQDHSDTRASVQQVDTDEVATQLIPYAPFAFFKGTCSANSTHLSWYKDFFDMYGCCCYIEVPGGAVFIGPGHISEQGEVDQYRYEFHPLASVLNPTRVAVHFNDFAIHTSNDGNLFDCYPAGDWYAAWNSMISHSDAFTTGVSNEGSTGVLSEQDDCLLFGSINFCVWVFMNWYNGYCNPSAVQQYYERGNVVLCASDSTMKKPLIIEAASFCRGLTPITTYWTELIKFAAASTDSYVNFEVCDVRNYEGGSVLSVLQTFYLPVDAASWSTGANNITANNGVTIGVPHALPSAPIYAMSLPKYNARTFWVWIAVSIIGTAVVTTTAVVCSIKFMKWRVAKRASNTARFMGAQSTYQDALSGVRTEIDPETGRPVQVTFDTTTAEGKAYIKECFKDYKRIAFKNNLWANIIGGTRYDVSTFYGQKEDDSSTDVKEGVTTSLNETLFGSSDKTRSIQEEVKSNEYYFNKLKVILIGEDSN